MTTNLDSPSFDLGWSSSEKVHELKSFVTLNNNFLQSTRHFVLIENGLFGFVIHISNSALKGAGKRDHNCTGIISVDKFFQFWKPMARGDGKELEWCSAILK